MSDSCPCSGCNKGESFLVEYASGALHHDLSNVCRRKTQTGFLREASRGAEVEDRTFACWEVIARQRPRRHSHDIGLKAGKSDIEDKLLIACRLSLGSCMCHWR